MQHDRAARELTVNRRQDGRTDHEQHERGPSPDPVCDKPERQIAGVGAELHGDQPSERSDDAHAGAAGLDGSAEKRRQPGEDTPVAELHGAAERDDQQCPAEMSAGPKITAEWVLRRMGAFARLPLLRLLDDTGESRW